MLFRRPSVLPADSLLISSLYSERTFYKAFVKDLKNSHQEVIIESPYLTTARTSILIPIFKKLKKRRVTVRVNTRYPGHHDQLLKIQAWQAIKQLRKAGVKVKFFYDFRHRKIAVIDGQILWEGSLNILSQSHSLEIMRRTESVELAGQMINFLGLRKWHW